MLLADDDALNRQLTSRILESRGWSVAAVGDGEAALARAADRHFDLVLLDVEMPGLDGPQVAERIRALEKGNSDRMMLCALTSHRRPAERRRCLAAGMDGYLIKPLEPEALDRLLAGDGRSAARERGRSSGSGAAVDWQQALQAVAGDRALLEELTASARGEVGERLAALDDAIAASDSEGARRAAHSLRGALRIFGAGPARELAATLERLAAEDRLDEADGPLARLAGELELVVDSLTAGPPPATESGGK